MPQIEIYDTEAAIAEQKRQQAADRARRYRAAKKANGVPDTNAVDSAIGEAVSLLSSVAIPEQRPDLDRPGKTRVSVVIDIAELHAMAVINLVRDGARRSYARQAVSARMDKRSVHDAPHVMPSRRLSDAAATIEKPVNNVWKDDEIGFVRKIVKRWRDAVTTAKS